MSDDNKIAKVTLDFSIDDIEDLPAFLQPPTGAYIMTLPEGITEKTIESDGESLDIFEMVFHIKEVLEFEKKDLDEGEDPPKPGDVFTQSFQRTNRFGMGNFKEVIRPIAEKIGNSSLAIIVGASKGLEVMVLITRTYNSKKKKNYSKIRKLELV